MAKIDVVETWKGPGRQDGIIVPLSQAGNAAHLEDHAHAFEHWYFDARLNDGHIVVGFLQTRELMTRKPGVELHIYSPDGTRREVIRRYPTATVKASTDVFDVRIGDNYGYADPALGTHGGFKFRIAEEDLEFDLTFTSEVPGWMPGAGRTTYGGSEYFAWAVGAPRAKVSGSVRIGNQTIDATGVGYHDHNWGVGDMKRIVDRWYWGRLYAEDISIVYASVLTSPAYGATWANPLMLAIGDEVVASTGEMIVETGPLKFNSIANREYPTTLRLIVPDLLDLKFTVRDIVHAHDLLTQVPVVRSRFIKPLVNRLGLRPGYFRFRSDFDLTVTTNGQEIHRSGSTLHEMVALR